MDKFKWSKRFKNKIFERFKNMVKIVKYKKKNDYNSIILAIQSNEDDKILEVLTGQEFKKFYRNKDNLFEKGTSSFFGSSISILFGISSTPGSSSGFFSVEEDSIFILIYRF